MITKYEAHNETTIVQFAIEQDAIDYANDNNMQVRTVQESITIDIDGATHEVQDVLNSTEEQSEETKQYLKDLGYDI